MTPRARAKPVSAYAGVLFGRCVARQEPTTNTNTNTNTTTNTQEPTVTTAGGRTALVEDKDTMRKNYTIQIAIEPADAGRVYRASVAGGYLVLGKIDRATGRTGDDLGIVGYGATPEAAVGDLLIDLGRDILSGLLDALVEPPAPPTVD